MENCVFCKVIKGEIPSTKVYEDDGALVFLNIEPVAEHHYLICPKKHASTFLDLDKDSIGSMLNAAKEVISQKDIKAAYKLVFNGGKYQSVPHVHWHLLAGRLEDGKNLLNHL